ncbi:MAG: class I SAM-dependent RNA methyltransferase [Gemmobacter sp.]
MILTIERLGHHGDGIAEGIFVPGALPGETVEGEVADGVMAAPRILTPSPARIRPPCAHARGCGGCALQHAAEGFVAEWKAGVVARALAAQGLAPEVLATRTLPAGTRQRATFAARRGRSGAIVGFHRRASAEIVPVPGCRVLHPDLIAALPVLGDLVEAGLSRSAAADILCTRTLAGLDIAVTGVAAPEGARAATLAAIAAAAGVARLSWGGEIIAQTAPPEVAIGRARVALPPGAFLQPSAEGAALLADLVRAAVGPARRVADLFAGIGTGAPELGAGLLGAARTTPGLRAVTAEARDLFRRPLLAAELARFDAVVIDPPRAGAEAQTVEIARARVPVVAMVSCNPASFARDARILTAAGYRLGPVQPVDQFRWSAHVELVACATAPP